jgi:hypothetical protein
MEQYKLYKNLSGEVTCVLKGSMAIPFDPANTDYQTFKKDLADGVKLFDAEGNVIDGIAYLEELV